MRRKNALSAIIFCLIIVFGGTPLVITLLLPNNNDSIDDPGDDNPSPIPKYNFTLEDPQYYFDLVNQAFSLSDSELELLDNNKFIVLNRYGTDDIMDAYKYCWMNDLPIMITTDAMLHTWHLVFDNILERVEEQIFFPLFCHLTESITPQALVEFNNGLIQNKTLIYFGVTLNITGSHTVLELPLNIQEAIDSITNAIFNEISINQAISQLNTELTKRFIDDFSQYKPRGHYIHSEALKSYFRLFKWFSRIPFFFDNYCGEGYLEETPIEMIQSAIEITYLLKGTAIPILENEVSGFEIWTTFKSFLDLLVGKSNSISILDIDNICREIIGDLWNLAMINDDLINQIQAQILENPEIPVPEIPFIIDIIVPGCTGSPKTFVFFGERLTLDSYAFQHLVHPYVDHRLLPVGLDFAATCLDSQRALELLADEFEENIEYHDAILNLIDEINNAPQEKKQTIQWQWIESLKHIAVNTPECDGSITIPEFMSTSNWLDEKVTSIMGSYAQLRHDTILYQKQSTTGWVCSTPTGYVEPYPEFYQSLGELSQYFKTSLTLLEDIGYNFSNCDYIYLRALDDFYNANLMLRNISIKELTESELTYEEKLFIVETYGEFGRGICGGPFIYGWLPGILKWIDESYFNPDINPNTRASLVADIHTDPNSGGVLHTATGILEPIIAIVPSWNGTLIPVVGPVFSYYEFVLSDYYRLNDYEWRGIIGAWLDINERENHNFDLFQRGFWANSYMANTEMTLSRIYEDDQTYDPPGWF